MKSHLSQDQFAKCVVAPPGDKERRHLAECSACSAELKRFESALLSFRSAIRTRIDERTELRTPVFALARPECSHTRKWQLGIVGVAAVVFAVLPLLVPINKSSRSSRRSIEQTDPNTVMERVHLHLSRTVPGPMEPVLSLIPPDDLINQPGVSQ